MATPTEIFRKLSSNRIRHGTFPPRLVANPSMAPILGNRLLSLFLLLLLPPPSERTKLPHSLGPPSFYRESTDVWIVFPDHQRLLQMYLPSRLTTSYGAARISRHEVMDWKLWSPAQYFEQGLFDLGRLCPRSRLEHTLDTRTVPAVLHSAVSAAYHLLYLEVAFFT